jgi:acyl dehydratase
MIRWDEVRVGAALPPLEKPPITTRQLVMYAGASGDFNPIHYDSTFAQAGGYPSVIAHGMLSMAFFGQLVSDWAGATAVARLAARFKAVTFPGDRITCSGEVVEKNERDGRRTVELKLVARNQSGVVTLEGSATVCFTDAAATNLAERSP